MTETMRADLFFLITAIAVVIITIALVILFWYVFKGVRDVREILTRVKKITAEAESDFEELRSNLKTEGLKAKFFIDAIFSLLGRRSGRTRSKKSSESPDRL